MSSQPEIQRDGVVWDLNSYFNEFKGAEMLEFKQRLADEIAEMQSVAEGLDVLSAETTDGWEALFSKAEDWMTRLSHVYSYVSCLSSADSAKEDYAIEEASLGLLGAEFSKFEVDVLRALKGASDEDFKAFLQRGAIKGMEYALTRLRQRSQHTMSTAEEKLSAELSVDGFQSWGRLYDTISGKLTWEYVNPGGKTEIKPISSWRSMMADKDFNKGQAAFTGGNKAWAGIEDVCAAALNAIAGTRLLLNKNRGYGHFLEPALMSARLSQETMDAMYQAIHANIETARDVFRTKAEFMGRDGIHWFEREAPLPIEASSTYNWNEGSEMVSKAFGQAYPKLADYYASFLKHGWMESQTRENKRPGAFCTGSSLTGEQRVYMTFNGSLGDVSTVAHEIGHAFHSHLLKELRPSAQSYPMTLAETASIFAEQILSEGVYDDPEVDDDAKLLMLDSDLCGGAILLLDITTRFEFEKKFHEERMKGEVPVSRLKELMVETQKEIMGDIMVEGGEDPLFWASKLHFYITGVTFYNFPYTFGFLLARALTGMFKKQGADFLPKYEQFLMLTGSHPVEEVVKLAIGEDTTDPAFWARALATMDEPLAQYKAQLKAKKG